MVHKNGSVIPVETASYLINDASGNGNRIVNLTWDMRTLEKTEQALALSEQKYYQLVMNLTVGVSLISPGGQVLDANNAMKKIMGLPLDVELPDLNFFSLEMMKRVGISPQLNKCIKTKENISGEIRVKSTQKKPEIVLTYSFLPVLNHEGEIEIILGYANDLSQQKRAEDETREQADFLNLVINAIKTPFFVKDEKHRWVMLNIAALDMMGHTRETLIGKSDYDLYPKEQADVFWKCDEKVFETGSYSNEEIITWSDGSLHTIVTHKQLYIEKTSRKKFIIGTIHDITKYKEIENELRTSELKYHELFDNANDFIITLEPEGRITNANRTLLKYFHTNLKSLTHYSVFNFISDEDKAYAFILRDKIMAGEPMNPFDIRTIGTSRNTVIYEVKASAIEQNNNITGIQCVLSDVTQHRAISIKLEEYNKNLVELNNAKDKFFSIIAHDLRNPFSSILGFTELLLDDLENISKEELKDSLKIVYNSAKNSLNLLENLLSWSRLETGRLPFDLTKVVLTDVIDEVIEVLFSLAYRKKIELINLVDPAVLLFADKNMMITILNNLIMNAIKYTPAGGKVRIFTGEHFFQPKAGKEFVTINVADTGVGMTQDFIDRLFSLSKPPSSPGTENEQGTGLGLVLTHEMIGKHGGTISVTSIPDKGSIFTFSIPLYKTENII
jgi:PAS domain S-box-containing protein